MADTNPGIGGLGAATRLTLEEFHGRPAPEPARRGNRQPTAAPPTTALPTAALPTAALPTAALPTAAPRRVR